MIRGSKVDQEIRLSEKITVYISFIVSIILILLSLYSLYVYIFLEFNAAGLVISLLFLIFGIFISFSAYNTYKKLVYESIFDERFRDAVISKFGSSLEKVASHQAELEALGQSMGRLEQKIDKISEGTSATSPIPRLFQRTLFLSLLTLGSLLFINLRISQSGAYVVLILFILWWWMITDEFDLFSDSKAHIFIISPLLVIPIASIVLIAFSNVLHMLRVLYLALVLYIFTYYSFATYLATGRIPFFERTQKIISEQTRYTEGLFEK
ncbi:MAG: hypothetical protein V3R86_06895, partial [Candidatus Hydrothermarchaeaceae archaeon]